MFGICFRSHHTDVAVVQCSYSYFFQQNKTDSIVASERGRRKNKKRGEAGSILPVFAEEWISLTQRVLND
jgi:hypothetical protein